MDQTITIKDQPVLELDELITLTKNFIALADELHEAGKLSEQEYEELTYIKKSFLEKAEQEKKEKFARYL